MSQIERGLRRCVACLAALAIAFCIAMPGWAKDAPAAASVPALPQPLTKESIRELVARLSDDDVRKLLLDQLDRAASAAPANAKTGNGDVGHGRRARRRDAHDTRLARGRLLRASGHAAAGRHQADRARRHVAARGDRGASRRAARRGLFHRVAVSPRVTPIPHAARADTGRRRFLRRHSGSAWDC